MLKDEYRKRVDSIHVRESLLDDMKTERIERIRNEQEKKNRRKPWMIAIPAFAAAAAVFVAVIVGINVNKRSVKSGEMSASADHLSTFAPHDPMAQQYIEVILPNAPKAVKSYDELKDIMETRRTNMMNSRNGISNGGIPVDGGEIEFETATAHAPTYSAPVNFYGTSATQFKTGSYSGTNIQVEGVDEADIVKTDGTWIYALNQEKGKVYILSAKGKDTEIVSSIALERETESTGVYYHEMMLYGDRLYLLGTHYNWGEEIQKQDRTNAFAKVYDISDRNAPKMIATHKQQGSYRTARLIDDLLVIVSDYRPYGIYRYFNFYNNYDREISIDEVVPKVYTDNVAAELAPNDIYVNPDSNVNGFAVVTTIRATDGKEFDSHKAVLGGCDSVYCNGTDLLIASNEYIRNQSEEQTAKDGRHFAEVLFGTHTNLFRFTIKNGRIEAAASTELPGTLLNQFSMDAYNGYFRVVVTRSDTLETIWTDGIDTYEQDSINDCALLVLDGELKTVGAIENLAKDERVQSVRFMGDTAYFVTFRQVDPLFAADLSDPKNPKVLSALKIPGFSAYLHPFGEGKLLGIGYDADEEHGWTENVKLSMFDISDPSDVREAFKLSVKDVKYTSVQDNHKIVFVDVKSGTVAFPADDAYLVFRADDKGFTEIGRIKTNDTYWLNDARGLFVDDVFYVVGEEEVVMLSFETMEELATIKFR